MSAYAPAVQQHLGLDLDQAALGVRVVAVAQQGRVAVAVAEEGLLAGGHELDRAAGLQREQPEGDLHPGVLAVAHRAGHSGDDDLDPVLFQPEAGGGQVAVGVRVGGGDVELHAAVGAGHGEAGLGADGGRVLAAHPVQALDDDLADRVRVAELQGDVPDQVAVGVQRGRREGPLRVDDGLQDLVLDVDGGGGEPGRVGVVGGHGGDGLAVVPDGVLGEDGAVGDAAPVHGVARDVLVGHHGPNAGQRDGLRGVDGQDAGVRVRGAQDGRPQQALGPQVGGVRVRALGLGEAVGGGQGGADAVRRGLLLVGAGRDRRGVPTAGVAVAASGPVIARTFRCREGEVVPGQEVRGAHAGPPEEGRGCGTRTPSAGSPAVSSAALSALSSRSATTWRTASRTPW